MANGKGQRGNGKWVMGHGSWAMGGDGATGNDVKENQATREGSTAETRATPCSAVGGPVSYRSGTVWTASKSMSDLL
jgi:hypothetical protein